MRRVGIACSVLLITGCASSGPSGRLGTWHPVGANAANITSMAANPRDLILGRSASRTDAHEVVGDIQRLWQGQPRPLPNMRSTQGGQN